MLRTIIGLLAPQQTRQPKTKSRDPLKPVGYRKLRRRKREIAEASKRRNRQA